jgi:putative FmdB family regulatory protein
VNRRAGANARKDDSRVDITSGSGENIKMPLFEYECRACGHHFEYLTRSAESPSCPSCSGEDLQKLLSVFAVSANGSTSAEASRREAPSACGMCGDPRGPGSCSVN